MQFILVAGQLLFQHPVYGNCVDQVLQMVLMTLHGMGNGFIIVVSEGITQKV